MTPRKILVGGWLVFLLYAYPGYMMSDAADQLVDARYRNYTDWHSVVMTEIWRLVGIVIEGPAGMLALQSLLLVAGTYHVARRMVSERAAAYVAIAVLLVPPALVTNAVVCAEAQLASWLLAGCAALLSERFRIRILGVALLVVACAMQDGGALAVAPIVIALFVWTPGLARSRRILIAVGAWLAVVVCACGLERALLDNRTEREQTRRAMSDVVGTLRFAGTVTDDNVRSLMPGVSFAVPEGIQARARAIYGKDLFYAAGDDRVFEAPVTDADRDALYAGRWRVVRAMPRPYLASRWRQAMRVLGVMRVSSWDPVYTKFAMSQRVVHATSHTAHHSLLQRALIAPVAALDDTAVFRPVVYLVLCIIFIGVAARRRERILVVLLLSGVLFELSLFVSATRAEYRDSHWMIATTMFAAAAMIAQRTSNQPPSKPRNERVDREAAPVVAGEHDGKG